MSSWFDGLVVRLGFWEVRFSFDVGLVLVDRLMIC